MKPSGFRHTVLCLALPLVLTACEVGPDYHQPAAPDVALTPQPLSLPTVSGPAGSDQNFVSGAQISGAWWTLLHSPALNSLIDTALRNNPTLDAAQQTLIQAEENARAELGVLAPALSATAQDQRARISSAELASTGQANGDHFTIPPYTLYNAQLSVSYDLDLWGGGRRDYESLRAQAAYERDELEAAYLSLTANIVTACITEASYSAQIDATNQIIATEQKQLSILETQVSLGGVPKANLLSEQAALYQTQATLPPLQSQLAQTRNQLADYVGAFPADFHIDDFSLASLAVPRDLPVSLPSALVDQRPDIQAAAAQLHEASANVGVATAEMLPQISLSADVGHEGLTTGSLFTPQTLLWSLVAGVTQPIFEGGELSAKRAASVAVFRAAGAQYQAVVLAAFENVANALEILQYDQATLQSATLAAQESQKSLAVTQDQYQLGGQPFTAVLTAQTTYQNAVITQVKAQAGRLTDTVALFQALGGGWWQRHDVSSAAANCCGVFVGLSPPVVHLSAPAPAAPPITQQPTTQQPSAQQPSGVTQ